MCSAHASDVACSPLAGLVADRRRRDVVGFEFGSSKAMVSAGWFDASDDEGILISTVSAMVSSWAVPAAIAVFTTSFSALPESAQDDVPSLFL